MKPSIDRRDFLKSCSQFSGGCALFLLCQKGIAQEAAEETEQKDKKIPNPKELTYCGFKCNMECNLYKATKENDTELKKKVYKEWKWKEQHDIEFDPDKVFCYGCKEEEKPKNLILQKCTVRPCAMGKKLDSCIQCSGLKDCDKELW